MTFSIGSRRIKLKTLNAFSILELAVVITIIAGLLALSLPRFRGTFNSLQFDSFCQDLSARMRYLNERAGFQQNIYRLSFDISNGVITIGGK
ncbi:Tfp pilus assembly protein FimT/FimU, partial [Thermoproteota archaeon]